MSSRVERERTGAQTLRSDAFASISRILDAARRMVGVGDGTASLERIAKEAGVGIATLYRHFPNRRALARAVVDRILASEVEPILAAIPAHSMRSTMLDLAERLAAITERERGFAASLGNFTDTVVEFLRRKLDVLAPAVISAQRRGDLRADIVPEDLPNLLAVMAAGVPALGDDSASRRRYLSLMLDALKPSAAEELPALPA